MKHLFFILLSVAGLGLPQTLQAQPSKATGTINGHEYVDLGLSVKWATCNIGASSALDCGDFFAWGETYTKSTYCRENCRTHKKNFGSIAGNSSYDTATSKWGGSWRMPTKAELQELIDNCEWIASDMGEYGGFIVKSKRNGNSVFLPAGGEKEQRLYTGRTLRAFYWSSIPSSDDNQKAFALYMDADPFYKVGEVWRDWGRSVRPVTK